MKKLCLTLPVLFISMMLFVSCDRSVYNELFEPVDQYTVTYVAINSTSGSVPAASESYFYGSTITILDNTGLMRGPIIQDGITQRFIGWNTEPDGSGTTYSADPLDTNITADSTFVLGAGDVTLYAQWTNDLSVLGKIGPAGGYIFYDDTADLYPGWRYMEVSPIDLATRSLGTGSEWGCFGTAISGADGTAIDTGPQNTADIIAGCSTTGIAADLCDDYSLNGYTDWFLPSQDELQLIRTNIYSSGFGYPWDSWYYWSSSEFSNNGAWARIVTTGGSTGASKGDFMSVRAVRRF